MKNLLIAIAVILTPNIAEAQGFVSGGKLFKSYKDFQVSPEWEEVIRKGYRRTLEYNLEKARKEKRREAAVRFEQNRRRYSPLTNHFRDIDAERDKTVRRLMRGWKSPYQNYTVLKRKPR